MTVATLIGGPREWSMQRDRDGNRDYKVTFLIETQTSLDGPAHILECPELPQPGDFYVIDNDADLWATWKLDADVKQLTREEPGFWWEITLTASTKPDGKRCKDQQIDDPLMVPDRISGGFAKYQEEAAVDRFGLSITNSAFELFHGPTNEWDKARPTVKIAMNRAQLNLPLLCQLQDCVNSGPMWGLPARCIKLSNITWDKKYYGQCFPYYEISLEFDIRFDTFDRDLLDEGTKALRGKFDPITGKFVLQPKAGGLFGTTAIMPNPANPSDYDKFLDRNGNPAHVVLNGHGLPANVAIGTGTHIGALTGGPAYRHVQKYPGANLLLLGVPTEF